MTKRDSTNGRICFIVPGNVFTTPYLKRYIELLQKPYDLVLWDCAGVDESTTAHETHMLKYRISTSASAMRKLNGYIRFMILAQRTITQNNYDAVVLITGVAAVLLSGSLKHRYANKYMIDIRDYYKENNPVYYKAEKRAIQNSSLTVISSEGFKSFLPEFDYTIVHNVLFLPHETIQQARTKRDLSGCSVINLSYIGSMRFIEQDKAVLKYFANDERFHINLFGRGYNELSEYCATEGICNVTIEDWFPPEKTLEFYLQTDIVLNLYGNDSPLLDYALSNKLYYAAQLGKPILVCPGTYMETVSKKYGFGFTIDLSNEMMKNNLTDYYRSIDWQLFYSNCDLFIKRVRDDDKTFVDAVSGFLNKI